MPLAIPSTRLPTTIVKWEAKLTTIATIIGNTPSTIRARKHNTIVATIRAIVLTRDDPLEWSVAPAPFMGVGNRVEGTPVPILKRLI